MKPAIFLDRDGTMIEDVGYIRHTSEVVFYPYSIKALHLLQEHFMLFIITNQSGIAKGVTTEEEVAGVNRFITETLKEQGIRIMEVFSCPHNTEDNCACKKPKTYFIEEAGRKYDIDLGKSFIIGDHPSDVQCGHNAGMNSIYVLTGHGEKHRDELEGDTLVCDNLLEAAEFIAFSVR